MLFRSTASCDVPLHLAAYYGHKELVELLLSKGADVNATDIEGFTPLAYASVNNQKETVEFLISRGAKEDLYCAVMKGDKTLCEKFINETSFLNKGPMGFTPLHIAVAGNNKELAEFLIARGSDVDSKTREGETPLFYAVSNGNIPVAELLVLKGADVNAKTVEGYTPLHWAAYFCQKDMIELLTGAGADVNAKNTDAMSVINMVDSAGYKDFSDFLKSGMDMKKKDGFTPLFVAVCSYDSPREPAPSVKPLDIVEHFISKGADVNISFYGISPLHLAVFTGNRQLCELLLSNGASVNARDNNGSTPLHIAALRGNKDIALFLISSGADVNIKDNEGNTPEDRAVFSELKSFLDDGHE